MKFYLKSPFMKYLKTTIKNLIANQTLT